MLSCALLKRVFLPLLKETFLIYLTWNEQKRLFFIRPSVLQQWSDLEDLYGNLLWMMWITDSVCTGPSSFRAHPRSSEWGNNPNSSNNNRWGEVGPTVCAPAVLPLSVRQSADAGFQSLLLQHAGRRAGRVEIQHLPGTHGQHVHAVKHDDGASFN